MKQLFTILTIALFSIGVSAQETKPTKKEKDKKESCCTKKAKSEKKDKKSCCVKK